MKITNVLSKAKDIIVNPNKTWEEIKEEASEQFNTLKNYTFPLIFMGACCCFIGNYSFGSGYSAGTSLTFAIIALFIPLISIYLTSLFVNILAPEFSSKANSAIAFNLVAYSTTAYYITAGISYLFGSLGWLEFSGALFTVYLLWEGITPMLNTKKKQRFGFVTITCIILFTIDIIGQNVLRYIAYS